MLHRILAVVRARSGVDFSGYRVPTVDRRIRNRMTSVGAASLAEYRSLLERSQSEARELLERITIKVSRFYRNRATFDLLRGRVLPDLARRGRALRVWSAGCGRGEEAYSLAMLLDEAGIAGTVHASDIDPGALAFAEAAFYPAEAAQDLPAELRERYLHAHAEGRRPGYRVAQALRGRVSFSRCDLTAPAVPGGPAFDLVCCRNVLIYWQHATQQRMLARLVSACGEGGYLCLGEAEWPHGPAAAKLHALDGSCRIFGVKGNKA